MMKKMPDKKPLEKNTPVEDDKEYEIVDDAKPKKKIPLHYWVLGAIILIPFTVPLIRLTEALMMLLLRIFI